MAERIPREQSLKRVHGPSALFAAAYGNVGSSVYYALGIVALYALGLTPVAFMLAGVLFLFTAATYAEGTVMYPEAGGSSSFARHAFNEVISFVAGWAQLLGYVLTIAISAYFAPHYLAVFAPALEEGPWDVVAAVAIVLALTLLNIRGSRESSRLNLVLVVVDICTAAGIMALGVALVLDPAVLTGQIDLGMAPSWGDLALGVGVAMIAYTGIETISNMAEEARKPIDQTVKRGVVAAVISVLALYFILPTIALSAMPVQETAGEFTTQLGEAYRENPVLGIVENMGLPAVLEDGLSYYVGLLAATILLTATNAGLIGVSRLTFSMGHHRQLPQQLRRLHPRYQSPYVALLVFAGFAALTILPGEAEFLATLYAFGAMLSFTIAHLSILRLRRSAPDVERAWKAPVGIRIGSTELPVTAVLGASGTGAVLVVVSVMNPGTMIVGGTWMILGLGFFCVYRRGKGLSLTQTVQLHTPQPTGAEDVEYNSILVAFDDHTPFSDDVIATAARLAGGKRRGIHVHSMITVPSSFSIATPMRAAEEVAAGKIERAKLIAGGMRVSGEVARVRPGEAGASACRKAAEIWAGAIVVGLRDRGGVPDYDDMVRRILGQRPCRVIVVSPGMRERGPHSPSSATGRLEQA